MIRRLAGAVLAACALFALLATSAAAVEVPAGPRLTFMRAGGRKAQLVSSDPAGQDQRVIFGGSGGSRLLPFPFNPPTWSADGTRVAFTGISNPKKQGLIDIYDAAADGSGIVKLPGTTEGFDPVFSPDGHTLAFAREHVRRAPRVKVRNASIWLLDLDSGMLRQLTSSRNGLLEFPSSFSPDGSTLAITRDQRLRKGRTKVSAVAIRLDGSGSMLLAENAGEPVYSPDGTVWR